jgi:hypothetical protein
MSPLTRAAWEKAKADVHAAAVRDAENRVRFFGLPAADAAVLVQAVRSPLVAFLTERLAYLLCADAKGVVGVLGKPEGMGYTPDQTPCYFIDRRDWNPAVTRLEEAGHTVCHLDAE